MQRGSTYIGVDYVIFALVVRHEMFEMRMQQVYGREWKIYHLFVSISNGQKLRKKKEKKKPKKIFIIKKEKNNFVQFFLNL